MASPLYSVVIPVFNEEDNLPELVQRLTAVTESVGQPYEVLFIDDGSGDRTLELLRHYQTQNPQVHYLSFARNFGHQVAVTGGLNFVSGKAVIVMDADLQDPPELIPELLEKWQQGYQVIYAQRIARHQDPWLKRLLAYGFYRVLRRLADVAIPTDSGDFCLMDQQVVDLLNSMPERNRYIRGLRAWVGFRQTSLQFKRDPRFAGDVKYTFRKSLSLAIDGIMSFSKVPLRFATYLGLLAAGIAVIMVFAVLYWRLFYPDSPLIGATIITIAIFFLGAVQLVCIGILGEYIGRIYEEVKGRPLYTIKELSIKP
jgi:dolichol-phosphate mannosyltransferase